MCIAQLINVRRDVKDPFYRYKMPPVQSKIEGKGNGIKTVLPNLVDVAVALYRKPIYVLKFFGVELGAQTKHDAPNERYIVNGAHDAQKLQELLDVFIKKFVLCSSCKNPETILSVSEKGLIESDCKACGKHFKDNKSIKNHKLTDFIVKDQLPSKKMKKEKKASRTKGSVNSERRNRSKLLDNDADESDDDGTSWTVNTSNEEVNTLQRALSSDIQNNLKIEGSEDEKKGDRYETLEDWLIEEDNKTLGNIDIFKKIQELGIESKSRTMTALGSCLFDENILKDIPNRASLLTKLVKDEKKQRALLGGIERLVGEENSKLLNQIPAILLALYQADILEEEVITQWGTHVSKKYVDKDTSKKVRKAAEPFIKWLETADEEESSEDREDE